MMVTKLTFSKAFNNLCLLTRFFLIFSILLLAGCPLPNYLTVEPENTCPFGDVVAKWKTNASNPTLSSNPPGIIQQKNVAKEGSEKLNIVWKNVPSNGQFDVKLDGLEDKVKVVPAAGDYLSMSFAPDCKTGTPKWADSLLPSIWGSGIKIKSVGNFTGRAVTVTYDGPKPTTIPSTGTSNVWNGLGLTEGDWSVSTNLEETEDYYEACQATGGTVATVKQHKLPPTIQLTITYGCPP